MKRCPPEARLGPFLDGEMPEAEAAAIETHLRECRACADELAALRQLDGLARSPAAPAVSGEEWAATWSAISSRVAAAPQPARRAEGLWGAARRLHRIVLPVAAAALVALGVGIWLSGSYTSAPEAQAVVELVESGTGYSSMYFYSSDADVTIITVLPTEAPGGASDDESANPT